MYKLIVIIIATRVLAENEETTSAQPVFKPAKRAPVHMQPPRSILKSPRQIPPYVLHQTYPYSDSYWEPLYDGFFYKKLASTQPHQGMEWPDMKKVNKGLIPETQGSLQLPLKILKTIGLILLGAVSLFVLGGFLNIILCYFTSICIIAIPGFENETPRSLLTSENISETAALIEDAIGKFQELQSEERKANTR